MARRINALIVEDSVTTRKLIMSILQQTGLAEFAFTEAADGLEALTKFRPGQTQLVFVDMNMPRMGGLELVRELRKRHRVCPPAVMITGETNTDRLKETLNEPGVAAFLLKPVDRDRLRTGLKTLVDSVPAGDSPCVVPYGECVPLAFQDVLAKACNLSLTSTPPDEALRQGDIVLGVISVFGAVQWSVSLGFVRDTAQAVAARFAGPDTAPDSLDVGDAIAELTNIVSGRIKLLLSAHDLAVHTSFPIVIRASELKIMTHRSREGAVAYTHFESPAGKLWTAVALGLLGGMVL